VLNVAWYGLGEPTIKHRQSHLETLLQCRVKTYPFDLKHAEQLLDEAGFPRQGRTRFSLTHDYQPFGDSFKRTGDYLKDALSKVGINVTVRGQDFPADLKRVYSDRDYDFTNHPFTNMFDPTVGLQRYFTSDNYRKGVAFTNTSHYASPAIDQPFADFAVEGDAARRKALVDRVQDIVSEDLPVISLILSRSVTIYNRRVVDHTIDATGVQGNFAAVWLQR
jgi:peptide/nickel transport system substrate-binding protein